MTTMELDLQLETVSNSVKLAIVNESIATGNYKKQMDCVRYLKSLGHVEPTTKNKEAIGKYLDAIAIELLPTATTEIEPEQVDVIINSAAESIGLVVAEVTEVVAEPIIEPSHTLDEIDQTDDQPSDPIVLSSADIERLKAIIVMRDPVEVINWAEDLAGYEGNDHKVAYKLLKDVLERHGCSRDPIADLLNKPKSRKRSASTGSTSTRKKGDRVLVNPCDIVKSVGLGTKTDYLVKAIARPSGASIQEIELLHHWCDNVKPALAARLGVSESDIDVPQLSDSDSITAILDALRNKYNVTPGMADMPKTPGLPWVNWDNGRVATRLNHRGPGYGCEIKGDRYYLLLPGEISELPQNIQPKTPSEKTPRTPRAPRASQDDIADLKSQNDALQAQLEEMRAMILNLAQKQA